MVTSDTGWISGPLSSVAFYFGQPKAILMLSDRNLDMPHPCSG